MGTRHAMLSLLVFVLTLAIPLHLGAETYSYDAAGRLTQVTYDDGTAIQYVYDAAGNRLSLAVVDDFDGDGASNASDNCPTVANAGQTDADGDTVGDACDTCAGLPNPPFTGTVLANMTFVSGQRDDDGDGIGNRCDFKYAGNTGTLIAPIDVSDMRSSVFTQIQLNTCGLPSNKNCAQFDHDELGALVAPGDVSLLRSRVFTTNGPSCTGGGCTPPFSCVLGGPGCAVPTLGKAECSGPAC